MTSMWHCQKNSVMRVRGRGKERRTGISEFLKQVSLLISVFSWVMVEIVEGIQYGDKCLLATQSKGFWFWGNGRTFLFLPATVILCSCACCFESQSYRVRCMPMYFTNSTQTYGFFCMSSHPGVRHSRSTAAALPCGGSFGVLRELMFPLLQLFPVPWFWDSDQLCLA